MTRSTTLTLRLRATPPLGALDALDRARLEPHLRAGRPLSDVTLFDVLDASGSHVYDLCLFRGEDGTVDLAGTLEPVAAFSQGSACETDDDALRESLDDALRRHLRARG